MRVDFLSFLSLLSGAPFVAIAAILGLYLLRRARWLRNPRTGKPLFGIQPSAVGLGMAFLFLQMFWRPSLSHAIEAREKVDVEEDDDGDPDTPEKQLSRQLKRIRRGEVVERLVLRM
jgi:hypothetical protein